MFKVCKIRILQTVYIIHVQLLFVYSAVFSGLPQSGKNQEETKIFHDQGKVSELFS